MTPATAKRFIAIQDRRQWYYSKCGSEDNPKDCLTYIGDESKMLKAAVALGIDIRVREKIVHGEGMLNINFLDNTVAVMAEAGANFAEKRNFLTGRSLASAKTK